jgi:AraC-like DNA-binding protein
MLVVETIARIRREHLYKGKSIKQIARELKLSRNTVRRILRSGETAFSYERETPATAEAGELDAGPRPAACGERARCDARATDADPTIRRASGAGLCGRL